MLVTLDTFEWLHLFFVRRLDSPSTGVFRDYRITYNIRSHIISVILQTPEDAYCSVGESALITVPSVGETAPYTSR
jgi:hypothetical protein